MNKRRILALIAFLAFSVSALFLLSCTSREAEEPTASSLHEQAIQVLVEARDREHYEQALALTTRALKIDPNYKHVLSTRSQIFLELGQPDKAIADLEEFLRIDDFPEARLSLCLIKDATSVNRMDVQACYQSVANDIKEVKANLAYRDVNYLLALKMSDAPTFYHEASHFIAEMSAKEDPSPADELNEELLGMDRDELLGEFMGSKARGGTIRQ